MDEFQKAIEYLKMKGVEAFVLMNILTIPVESVNQIEPMAGRIRKLLKDCGYQKSWRIDPYYYERHNSVTADMYDN